MHWAVRARVLVARRAAPPCPCAQARRQAGGTAATTAAALACLHIRRAHLCMGTAQHAVCSMGPMQANAWAWRTPPQQVPAAGTLYMQPQHHYWAHIVVLCMGSSTRQADGMHKQHQ